MEDITQFGEGKIIRDFFLAHPPRYRNAVEVGSIGRDSSNVLVLAREGWELLVIEPNPDVVGRIEADYAGTNFRLVRCGVGSVEGVMPFYVNSLEACCSFKKDWYPDTRTALTYSVAVRPLADVLEEHRIPFDFDFLSLDAEGMDMEVAGGLLAHSQYRPGLVVTESVSYGSLDVADALFKEAKYARVAQTGTFERGNLFYARQ